MSNMNVRGQLFRKMEDFMNQGNKKKALKVGLKLLKMDPKNLDILYNVGIIYAHLGDIKNSVKMNMKILEIEPKDPDALINMAQVNEMKGNRMKARDFYIRALEEGFNRIFRVDKLWEIALDYYKNDREKLKSIADECVYHGEMEKLTNLEATTRILGPEDYKLATRLSGALTKFQMLVGSHPVLTNFPEKFFATNEVWEEFLKLIKLDVGVTFFYPRLSIPYEDINFQVIDIINSLELEKMAIAIIHCLDILVKAGKYETTEQMMAKQGKYVVKKMS